MQIIHESLYDEMVARLKSAYATVPIGDPLEDGTLMGPLHNAAAVAAYEQGLQNALDQVGGMNAGTREVKALAVPLAFTVCCLRCCV